MPLYLVRYRMRRRILLTSCLVGIVLGFISLFLAGSLDNSAVASDNINQINRRESYFRRHERYVFSNHEGRRLTTKSTSIHSRGKSELQNTKLNQGNQNFLGAWRPLTNDSGSQNERNFYLFNQKQSPLRFNEDQVSPQVSHGSILSSTQSQKILDLRPEGLALRNEVTAKGAKQLTGKIKSLLESAGKRAHQAHGEGHESPPGDLPLMPPYPPGGVSDKAISNLEDIGNYDKDHESYEYDDLSNMVPKDVSLNGAVSREYASESKFKFVARSQVDPNVKDLSQNGFRLRPELRKFSKIYQAAIKEERLAAPRPPGDLDDRSRASIKPKYEAGVESGPCADGTRSCQTKRQASKHDPSSKRSSHQSRSLSHPLNSYFDAGTAAHLNHNGFDQKPLRDEILPQLPRKLVASANDTKIRKMNLGNNTLQLYQHASEHVHRKPLDAVNLSHKIETQIPIQEGVGIQGYFDNGPATQLQMPELPWQRSVVRSPDGVPLVVDKIYWSTQVEELLPSGVTDDHFQHFLYKIGRYAVKEMHAPLWNRCGRPKNQFIILQDNTQLCARYRHPHDKLVHGEVLSFYLSRLLGLENVPAVVLSLVNSTFGQWRGHNLTKAEWKEGEIVALIEWIDGMDSEKSRVKMPGIILEAYKSGKPINMSWSAIPSLSATELVDLMQWSDMVLFDYLTGHYDRVASMQDGADREHKPSIITENIRNLRKIWQTGQLWLIDNESGMFDAYELMYKGGPMGEKFIEFHKQMLQSICIFHRKTVDKIRALSSLDRPYSVLESYAKEQDPLYSKLKKNYIEYNLFKTYFHKRLKEVIKWIDSC